jgi:hypothetical protein
MFSKRKREAVRVRLDELMVPYYRDSGSRAAAGKILMQVRDVLNVLDTRVTSNEASKTFSQQSKRGIDLYTPALRLERSHTDAMLHAKSVRELVTIGYETDETAQLAETFAQEVGYITKAIAEAYRKVLN